jgi:hypothetical protein
VAWRGHKLCSPGLVSAIASISAMAVSPSTECMISGMYCSGNELITTETCFWKMLEMLRASLEGNKALQMPLGE